MERAQAASAVLLESGAIFHNSNSYFQPPQKGLRGVPPPQDPKNRQFLSKTVSTGAAFLGGPNFLKIPTRPLWLPTTETYVFYKTFEAPTLQTYVFYRMFETPTIQTHVFYDTFEWVQADSAVLLESGGLFNKK